MNSLTTQEELVLLSVGSMQPEAYAYGIQQEIKSEANKSFSLGTIHTILYRMEGEKLLKSHMGGSSSKRGGRSKRLFSLTSKGYELIDELQRVRQSMWNKVSPNHLLLYS